MKTIHRIAFIVFLGIGCSCTKSKQQLLPKMEEVSQSGPSAADPAYESAVTLDTIIPQAGIASAETRLKGNPTRLRLLEPDIKAERMDLKAYYSQVRYVKLTHPLSGQAGFISRVKVYEAYEAGPGLHTWRSSAVYYTGDYLIAGDKFFGYHCYDKNGKFIYTVAASGRMPNYRKGMESIDMNWRAEDQKIYDFTLFGNNCIIRTMQYGKLQLLFHNIRERATYFNRPWYGDIDLFSDLLLLSPESFAYMNYRPAYTKEVFMYSFNLQGDTLCAFANGNPVPPEPKNNYSNPEHSDAYYYQDKILIRQAYNDTLFRVNSPSELEAAYVFDLGKDRMDIETGLYGDATGKYILHDFLETKYFLRVSYGQRTDSKNRDNKPFFDYSVVLYDKKDKQLIGYTAFSRSINITEDDLPLFLRSMQTDGNSLYMSYTRSDLKNLMENTELLNPRQQAKAKELHDAMEDDELWVMLVE